MPVGLLLIALAWILRGVGQGSVAKAPSATPRARTETDGWIGVAILIRLVAALSLMASLGGLIGGSPSSIPSIIALVCQSAILFPSVVIDRVLVPLGLVQTTFWYSRVLCPFRRISDPLASAVIDASRALRASRGDRAKMAADLGFERLTWRGPVGSGWALVAWAELADVAGDGPRARQLFETALRTGGRSWAAARWHARTWLMAEAAQRGDWERVIRLGHAAPRRHEARELARIAEVLLLRVPRHRARLVARWLVTPSRVALFPWVRKALAMKPRPARVEVPDAPSQPADEEPLRSALVLHATLVAEGASVRWSELADLVRAWESVVSPGTDALLGRRIAVLGARMPPATARDSMLHEAQADLARILALIAEPMPADVQEPPLLHSLRHAACDAWLAAFESLVERLPMPVERPVHAVRPRLPESADSWAAWGAVRVSYDGLARLSTKSELAWVMQRAWSRICNHGAWLGNAGGERALAHDVFVWLHHECKHLGVPADMKLLRNNAHVTA